jgi:hypothetical protein
MLFDMNRIRLVEEAIAARAIQSKRCGIWSTPEM